MDSKEKAEVFFFLVEYLHQLCVINLQQYLEQIFVQMGWGVYRHS